MKEVLETASETQLLLVLTVGGSPEPVVTSILDSRPSRVIFLCSGESAGELAVAKPRDPAQPAGPGILERVALGGWPLVTGMYDVIEFEDPQNMELQVRKIRQEVSPAVARWTRRGENFQVCLDITGGTKVMSVAASKFARRWICPMKYIGGRERDRGNLGVVVSGTEEILQFDDPWSVLGWEVAEKAVDLYHSGALGSAEAFLRDHLDRIAEPVLRRALMTLHSLLKGFLLWDRFAHQGAFDCLNGASANVNLLAPLLSQPCIARLGRELPPLCERLHDLLPAKDGRPGASFALVEDLMANAARRMAEERFDDAVARYYRALEATAQWRLASEWGIPSAEAVPVQQVPRELAAIWLGEGKPEPFRIGLQDAFRLLAALGDEFAGRFHEAGLAGHCSGWESPDWGRQTLLSERNRSILAHGFTPIGQKVSLQLQRAAERVTGVAGQGNFSLPELEVA